VSCDRAIAPSGRAEERAAVGTRPSFDLRLGLTENRTPGDDETMSESPEITTKVSPRPVSETVTRLVEMVEAKGMKVFAVIDQAAEALSAGLELRPTTLVLFGNPTAGTQVMDAVPLVALDLPLKVLVWGDGQQTMVSYLAPDALGRRYHLSSDLASNLAGINPLTDALVAP
jgi:uncharacterized protein (DUF302 family)